MAADRLWSAEQQGWLRALGHAVYLPADWPTEAGAPVVAEAPVARTEAVDPAPTAPAALAPRARPPAREAMDTPAPVRPPPAPRAGGAKLPDRLHFALIRASGCNPNAPGAAALFSQWPSSADLRGNPAAKRALWPTLRRLRRDSPA
ncbi:alanine acetyltransferase [Pseudoxanthomonas sp. LjRoot143]|uniref:alanine acetyltransferase n=1 Tax=unclassified Pseudoxanthomonas TaxID=2645906 RepID=UPI00177AD857|nr:alanine acetyltransferase [Pseudoxanthomonas sp. PXM01]MBD9468845.1 alanine acetyltransferase [Pseudoxanthomonas sp. PXM01]